MSDNLIDPKQRILSLFLKNVKGKKPNTTMSNSGHDGKEGHWLETQMKIEHNASNSPDIFGFEMKNDTTSKTTFGDWSPNYRIWLDKKYPIFNSMNSICARDKFMEIFGKPNPKKGGRFSWSGEPLPKINSYSTYGQIMSIDADENISILYSYSKDKRINKNKIVPLLFQIEDLILVTWQRDSLKLKLERKFNNLGWFKCLKNNEGVYSNIVFGDPITWESWLNSVRKGLVFFDGGMHQGNPRPYSEWRANNQFWEKMITDKY